MSSGRRRGWYLLELTTSQGWLMYKLKLVEVQVEISCQYLTVVQYSTVGR